MPDISKCDGKNCPLKEKCYRFTATSDKYGQSYFSEPPFTIVEEKFNCNYFWNNEVTN